MTFDELFMNVAHTVAQKSKDPSTKVGCIIVGPDNEPRSFGWNGMSRGVFDLPERLERPEKYSWIIHAERNAIANAARVGIPLKGCKMYTTHMCCLNCADDVIQAGIIEVIVGYGKLVGDHKNEIAMLKFAEASVLLSFMESEGDHV